ncbi:MAG: hypothetical protein LBB46_01355 [Coriobacteriaceae bacterium]|nr:hypothetical protein [Coriobacteriaceae bacterium]
MPERPGALPERLVGCVRAPGALPECLAADTRAPEHPAQAPFPGAADTWQRPTALPERLPRLPER